MTAIQGPPERVGDAIRHVHQAILPIVQQMDGYRGYLALIDRRGGRAFGITLWESEGAERASMADAANVRREGVRALGAEVVSVESYEVAVADL